MVSKSLVVLMLNNVKGVDELEVVTTMVRVRESSGDGPYSYTLTEAKIRRRTSLF
jgi:hypothetical protein